MDLQIETEYHIRDLETLKVISDPLRVQILERIGLASDAGQLMTVKQLAEALDTPPTKLYYHINLLEKHDLICIAETQVVSGIIEKHYRIRARRFRIDLDISKNTEIDRDQGIELTLSSIATMFASAQKNLEQSLRLRRQDTAGGDDPVAMLSTQATLQLSPEQADDFIARVNELVQTFSEIKNPDGLVFGLTALFNPNYHIQPSKVSNQILGTGPLQNPIPGIDDRGVPIPPQI